MLLQQEWIRRLHAHKLVSSNKWRGAHKGSHRSQRFGSSLDFSDYREYSIGDDVRQVDWNVYARTEKFFIKRYLDEQEMRVQIVLDATKSMGLPAKWLLARQIAYAFGLLVLQQDDRLTMSVLLEDDVQLFRKKGKSAMPALTYRMNEWEQPMSEQSFSASVLRQIDRGQTVVFIITDALEPLATWEPVIAKLPQFARDVRIVRIADEEEIEPKVRGEVALVDRESGEKVNVSMTDTIRKQYEERRRAHFDGFTNVCQRYGVATIELSTADGFSHHFFHRLRKANWIR